MAMLLPAPTAAVRSGFLAALGVANLLVDEVRNLDTGASGLGQGDGEAGRGVGQPAVDVVIFTDLVLRARDAVVISRELELELAEAVGEDVVRLVAALAHRVGFDFPVGQTILAIGVELLTFDAEAGRRPARS